ncbi:discoidin domain-containing protein [Vibrio penaeicida]|uniref:galactose-binding domain-containing protein n=1 Tax=Vibrio penaeicida TaxID=104609 RepID=UPI0027368151|nr:discoidin domain-containing protein [Vibrio penaeicida]MDP2572087.1 discoidin domain-containing protein [Vibrio penaeicida]
MYRVNSKTIYKSLLFIGLFFSLNQVFAATKLYVSKVGNDNNSGTIESPFATLEKAKRAVNLLLQQPGDDINVLVRGGTYYLDSPLTFGPSDSGSTSRSITYSSYPGENVVISGGKRIQPTWQGDVIKQASIGRNLVFDQLFVNDSRQILARYPNYDKNVAVLNGYSPDATSAARIETWSNPAGGFLRGIHDREWGGNSYKILGKRGDELDLEWIGDNNRGSSIHVNKRMVENIFEELDSPGEWFYNKQSGILYYYPADNIDLDNASIEIAVQEELIRVLGTSENKVSHLTFSGFTFTHTHRTMFTRPHERPLRSDWGFARAGAVYIENARNIAVRDSKFEQVGGNAIFVSGDNQYHVFDNNDVTDAGSSAFFIAGLQSAARDPSTWDFGHKASISDEEIGPQSDDYPKNITISRNYINNIGIFEKQTSGVQITMSQDILVSQNTIHKVPRAGINIGDGTWGGHIIEFNDIWDTVRETHDHGAFNSWGRDRFWSLGGFCTLGCKGELKEPYAFHDAVKTTTIRNNRINHPTHGWGIDLDDGSSNYDIYNNLVLGGGIKLREGFGRNVHNNILVNDTVHLHVAYSRTIPALFDRVENNIIVNDRRYELVRANIERAHTVFGQNVFWNNGTYVEPDADSNSHDQTSIVRDPAFSDVNSNDYTINADLSSQGIDFNGFPMNSFGKPGDYPRAPSVNGTGEKERPDPEPLMDASITSIYSTALRSALGLPSRSGIAFSEVHPSSYAYSQGFRESHALIELDGTSLTTDKDYFWQVYNKIEPGTEVNATTFVNQMPNKISFSKTSRNEMINDTSGVVYSSDWEFSEGRSFGDFNDDVHFATSLGQSFELEFYGTGIEYISEKNADMGTVDIYIDDEYVGQVDARNPSRLTQQVLFSVNDLSPGLHKITGVMTGGQFMLVDAFRILRDGWKASNNELINDTSGVVYSSDWEFSEGRPFGDFNDDVHFTTSLGQSFELEFYGTGIEYISEKNGDMGTVDIYIDDDYVGQVNAHNSGRLVQQVLFSVNNLSPGFHKITGVMTGGQFMLVDAFNILRDGSKIHYPNVARGKVAVQSSTSYGGAASRAVDGSTDGSYSSNSTTHTNISGSANTKWWQVDLEQVHAIEQIKIWNRTDCCSHRLQDYYVFVSDQPFQSGTLSELLSDATIKSYKFTSEPTPIPYQVINLRGITGQYVRLQLNGSEDKPLSLAEVEVFGLPNVAESKSAQQSNVGYDGEAERALDGNTDGNFHNGSVTHTEYGPASNHWWQVDLGKSHMIGHVKLSNRTDCCSSRLSNYYVLVSNTPFSSDDLSTLLSDPSVAHFNFRTLSEASQSINLNNTHGRYVRIQLEGNHASVLSLAEVQVFALEGIQ